MTAELHEQAVRALQEAIDEHSPLTEVWITSDGTWVGIALTLDEAFALADIILPEPDVE